ncbi:MAG TPA: HAD family hydrolase [Candidatus Binatia bacterium]|nr:HAD family hydrolase [Candidatus Binatia bacterium]
MAVAALFDIDGTLLARNTAPLYMNHLRRTGQARRRDLARTLYYLFWYKLGLLDVRSALEVSMAFVRGRDEAAMVADCVGWYREAVRPYVFPGMAAQVAAHREAGHVLAILTSATRYLAEPLGADLGIEHHLVTQLVVRDGRFTGEVVQPVCFGRGKIYWAERFAAEHGVDLAASFFYTDSITDLPLLDRVGHPRVVHPDPRLRRLAQRRGWQVLRPRLDEVIDTSPALVG